jgi:hypothetical protein
LKTLFVCSKNKVKHTILTHITQVFSFYICTSHIPHITQYKHAAVFDVRKVFVHGVGGGQGEGHAGGGGGEMFRSVDRT